MSQYRHTIWTSLAPPPTPPMTPNPHPPALFRSLLSAHHVARHWPHRRAGLDIMRRKIKELTPCHAKSIQGAITVPWQQMKTRRPSLDRGQRRFTRLHRQTDWHGSSRGLLWQQTDHMQRRGCQQPLPTQLPPTSLLLESAELQEIRLTVLKT